MLICVTQETKQARQRRSILPASFFISYTNNQKRINALSLSYVLDFAELKIPARFWPEDIDRNF